MRQKKQPSATSSQLSGIGAFASAPSSDHHAVIRPSFVQAEPPPYT